MKSLLALAAASRIFFAQCDNSPLHADIYVGEDGHSASAVVRGAEPIPTVIDAEIVRDVATKRFRIHFLPVWGIADFTSDQCRRGTTNASPVTEFEACLYWIFGGADVEHATLAELVKKKEAIPCQAHVQCETPDRGDIPICSRMRLLERILPVDSDHAKLCSVK